MSIMAPDSFLECVQQSATIVSMRFMCTLITIMTCPQKGFPGLSAETISEVRRPVTPETKEEKVDKMLLCSSAKNVVTHQI